MENQTSFDLNQSVQSWRENLGQSPAFQRENLDELEAHLRDSIGRLQTAGLTTEEAFGVAIKRAGTADLLAAEFGKVNSQAVWVDRIFWMLVGLQMWRFVDGFLGQISAVSFAFVGHFGRPGFGGSTLPTQVFLSLSHLATMAVSLWLCWWLIMRKGPAATNWINRSSRRRIVLVVAGLFVGILTLDNFANFIATIMILKRGLHLMMLSNLLPNLLFSIIQSVVFFLVTVRVARRRLTLRMTA